MEPFFRRVYQIVAQIPCGQVATYGQIARLLGDPRKARQVGWAMIHCPDHLPWQRVIRADGAVAGGAHAELCRAMLAAEGVSFLPDGRVDLASSQWRTHCVDR